MSYRQDLIPDSPMPLSMLPNTEALKPGDLFYVVQPLNNAGQRCRKLEVGTFMADSLVASLCATNAAPIFSNRVHIENRNPFHYGSTDIAGDLQWDKLVEADVPADAAVFFRLSALGKHYTAGQFNTLHQDGLRIRAYSYWRGDDLDRFNDYEVSGPPSIDISSTDIRPKFNCDVFGCFPQHFAPPGPGGIASNTTRHVILEVQEGVDADIPSASGGYDFYTEIIVVPKFKYNSSLLVEST